VGEILIRFLLLQPVAPCCLLFFLPTINWSYNMIVNNQPFVTGVPFWLPHNAAPGVDVLSGHAG
jgi:hypothetical protein